MNFRSIQDLNEAIVRGLPRIPRDVDLVVGIPRSGLLAGSILALHLNVPLTDLQGLIEGRTIQSGPIFGFRWISTSSSYTATSSSGRLSISC